MNQTHITIKDLTEFFDSKSFELPNQDYQIDPSESIFLENRSAIEADSYFQSLEGYYKHYDLLCEFGLEENILLEMKPYLEWLVENNPSYFLSSKFYHTFCKHQIVVDATSSINEETG